ncbi:hypothetical protein GCM10029978_048500 [Actinoallomurus acanthiterrae]
MSTPNGEDGVLYELEIEVEEELTVTETSDPETDVPVADWLFDPADTERERTGLRGLLGAIQALEDDSRPGDQGV